MRLIENIGKWWNSRKQSKDIPASNMPAIPANDDNLALVNVALKKDMSLEIACWWDDPDKHKELAFAFGTLLKFLTNGGYDVLIAQSLADSLELDDGISPQFIEEVLTVWKSTDFKKAQEDIKNMPVINPLRTFGESNFGGPG